MFESKGALGLIFCNVEDFNALVSAQGYYEANPALICITLALVEVAPLEVHDRLVVLIDAQEEFAWLGWPDEDLRIVLGGAC